MLRIALSATLTIMLAGCATSDEGEAFARDFTPVAPGALTPQARLYTACLGQAIAAETYSQISETEGDGELILFSCQGETARALYDALEQRSLDEDGRWEHDGWSYRSTNRIQRDLFGADWCATQGGAYRCAINLNLGWAWPG